MPAADQLAVEAGLAAGADAGARRAAERALTAAYLRWATALHTPALGQLDLVVPEALAPPPEQRRLIASAASASDLGVVLAGLETRHPFYNSLRAALAAELDGRADPARVRALRLTLERVRLLPQRGRHIVVDTASQQLWMFDGPVLEGRMRVIVGASDNPTPTMASLVEEAIARPYWNVPEDLGQTRIARRVLGRGTGYLKQQHLEILSDWTDDAVPVSPASVDWASVAARRTSVRLRQAPGPWNMMGAMKFLIRNDRGIYLHDTPERALFKRERRTLSAGCIRVEDWRRLADWLFEGAPPSEEGAPERTYPISPPVPIYVLKLSVDPSMTDKGTRVVGSERTVRAGMAS